MEEIRDISKQPLIEWGGQVVITTAQLAEAYGATKDNISDNFNRNKERFTPGKHYILLTGAELKEFKSQSAESGLVAKTASQLYLWTRRGASRHCKILGTDKAWEQFDYLEENYFDRREQKRPQLPQTTMELLELHYKALKEVDSKVSNVGNKVETLEDRFNKFEEELPMLPDDADEVHDALNKRVVLLLGGGQSNAYKDKSLTKKVFIDAYRVLKYNFGVTRYKAIKRNQKAKALQVIEEYKPPVFLAEQIETANAQQRLDV